MKIGYALYSAREAYNDPKSLEKILRELARMGYDGVEFFNYAGIPANELAAILKDTGLEAPSSHIHMERWQADTYGEIDYAAQAGIGSLVFPWLSPEHRTAEVYTELAKKLPEMARLCAAKGVGLQYHNHDFEFVRMGTQYAMDFLLQSKGFQYEIDTFWVAFAKVDPIDYMRTYKERIDLVHVKDYSTLEPQHVHCPIGEGKMDNTPIIQEASRLGKQWVFVELDDCPMDPMEAASISLKNIRKALA